MLVFPSTFFQSKSGLLQVRFVIASSGDGEFFFSGWGVLPLYYF